MSFEKFKSKCPYLLTDGIQPRPVNGLNVEPLPPSDRCSLKLPKHWPKGATAGRWLMSGGDIFVFGHCNIKSCALGHEWCPECGHRKESHTGDMCLVDVAGWPCGCGYYKKITTAL